MTTKIINSKLFLSSGCLSQDTLQRMLLNELQDDELSLVQEHLDDCEFCSLALEGYQENKDKSGTTLIPEELNDILKNKTSKPANSGKMAYFAAAASILLVIGIGFYFFFQKNPVNQSSLAENKMPVKAETSGGSKTFSADSVSEQTLTLNNSVNTTEKGSVKSNSKNTAVHSALLAQNDGNKITEKSLNSNLPIDRNSVSYSLKTSNPPKSGTSGESSTLSGGTYQVNKEEELSVKSSAVIAQTATAKKAVTADTVMLADKMPDKQKSIVLQESAPESKSSKELKSPNINYSKGKAAAFVAYSEAPNHPPKFPTNTYKSFDDFIAKNIIHPQVAQNSGKEEKVTVSFTVKMDGKLANIKVISSTNENLNNEAVRLIQSSPAWEPAYKNQQPVDMEISYTINFK